MKPWLCLYLCALGLPMIEGRLAAAVAQGTLESTDQQSDRGAYEDVYSFQAHAGQRVDIEVRAPGFRPRLLLRAPSGAQTTGVEAQEDPQLNRIDLTLTETGLYSLVVTSREAARTGAYTLSYPMRAEAAPGTRQSLRGALGPNDDTLPTGEYHDRYTFEGVEGQIVIIDLFSEKFDTYLILRTPGGGQLDNDDHEEAKNHSRIATDLPETGRYEVIVTSFSDGERGSYTLELPPEEPPAEVKPNRRLTGELTASDPLLPSGEHLHAYTFAGRAGQPVIIDLRSDAFDPYLILQAPSGQQYDSDDYEDDDTHSRIARVLTESGTYQLVVTSYGEKETGAYVLELPPDAEQIPEHEFTPPPPPPGEGSGDTSRAPAHRDALDPGASPLLVQLPAKARRSQLFSQGRVVKLDGPAFEGHLEIGDSILDQGEFADLYLLEGMPGEQVAVSLRSSAFDPYLVIITPSGRALENDDFENDIEHARLKFPIEEPGVHSIIATSFSGGETGAYRMKVERVGHSSHILVRAPSAGRDAPARASLERL